MAIDYRQGIRKSSGIASMVAAATSVALHTPTANRTCVLRKIHIWNGQAANVTVQIGTGITPAFVQVYPNIVCVPGLDLELREEDILNIEFTAALTVQASAAAAAPANETCSVEVEEYQGITG